MPDHLFRPIKLKKCINKVRSAFRLKAIFVIDKLMSPLKLNLKMFKTKL